MPNNPEKTVPGPEQPRSLPDILQEVEKIATFERAPTDERQVSKVAPPPVVESATAAPAPAPRAPDPVLLSVERILQEDLFDFYRTMSPDLQASFKTKGEETAAKIRKLVSRATVKAKEILKLIVSWLKLIPGINAFFLEQESKIKTDKIIELHKREHEG